MPVVAFRCWKVNKELCHVPFFLMYPTTKNIVNSDTFVILYYNPQMAEDGELMSLPADSSCQLLGGKVENPSMPSTLFFVCLFVCFGTTLYSYTLCY